MAVSLGRLSGLSRFARRVARRAWVCHGAVVAESEVTVLVASVCFTVLGDIFELPVKQIAEPILYADEWPSQDCSRANLTPVRILCAEEGCD
jgi:hypothetical protein